jgi:outer membrane protein assembly factor BamA
VIDIRKYLKIGPIIFAGRLMQNSLFGEVPIYRMNYIGFSERVRGHFYNVREGKHVQIAGIETRFNIIPIRYFSFNLPAIPPQYLTNLKFGLSAALFIDTGIVWDKSNEYKYDNFTTGFGLGLHLHLPYVEVFRFDYGFDRNWKGQLTMEVGVVF